MSTTKRKVSDGKRAVLQPPVVEALREKREELALAQHKANSLNAELQLMIAESLKEVNQPISQSAVCLECGTVRSVEIQQCEVCQK